MKYERYTESNAKPQGLNTATRPALKAIPDLSNVDRFEKKVLVLAEISKPKNNIFEIFSLSRKKPNKTKNIRYLDNQNNKIENSLVTQWTAVQPLKENCCTTMLTISQF